MPRVPKKALQLSTEIDIHAVSCPGVILLNRGRLALSLCLLGFHTRTGRLPAKFPIEFREKFKFDRTFVSVTNLSVLERVLDTETVYLELIQEETSGETVLAVFESSVRDLLFPRQAERLSYSGNDLDLLMEPTRDFPGIISPKIEVSTRTVIGETRTPLHQCSQDNVSFGHTQQRATKATYKPLEGASDGEKDPDKGPCKNKAGMFGSSKTPEEPIRNRILRPPFAYKRPENRLLSQLPPSPTRNNRYLGIRSRYLSRSAGNITDLSRPEEIERSSSKANLFGSVGNLSKPLRRKCYAEDAENARVTLVEPELYTGDDDPARRPASAPPTRGEGSGISADEYEANGEEERDGKNGERKGRTKNKDTKRLSFSRSVSRSPSPPASHASAPPVLSRNLHRDSDDDDDPLDEFYYRRRYGYPSYYSRPYYPYDYECPLCDPTYSRLSKYYRKYSGEYQCYHEFPKPRSYYSDLYHSKENCSVCYKYGLYQPNFYQRSKYYPLQYPYPRRYRYWDSLPSRYDSDMDSPRDKKFSRGTKVKFRKKRERTAVESADEILSDVYNNDGSRD